jgi:hypothetical protein
MPFSVLYATKRNITHFTLLIPLHYVAAAAIAIATACRGVNILKDLKFMRM